MKVRVQIWHVCVRLPGQMVTCLYIACCVRSSFLHSGHISGLAKTDRKLIRQNVCKIRIFFPCKKNHWNFKQLAILLGPITPIICRIRYWLWRSRQIYVLYIYTYIYIYIYIYIFEGKRFDQERFLEGITHGDLALCEVKPSAKDYVKNIWEDELWIIGHFSNFDKYRFLQNGLTEPPTPDWFFKFKFSCHSI